MQKRSKYTLLCLFAILALNNHLEAAKKHPYRIEVCHGGYQFHSSYKLVMHPANGSPPSKLKVQLLEGSKTGGEKQINGRLVPTAFFAVLGCKLNGQHITLVTQYFRHHKKAMQKNDAFSSSEWYPGIKEILRKVADKHVEKVLPWRKRQTRKWAQLFLAKDLSQESPRFQIKPLSGCRLENDFSLHIRSDLPSRSPISPRIIVHVTTQRERVASLGNKKFLTLKATFCTIKRAQHQDPDSVLKFALTKKRAPGNRENGSAFRLCQSMVSLVKTRCKKLRSTVFQAESYSRKGRYVRFIL